MNSLRNAPKVDVVRDSILKPLEILSFYCNHHNPIRIEIQIAAVWAAKPMIRKSAELPILTGQISARGNASMLEHLSNRFGELPLAF